MLAWFKRWRQQNSMRETTARKFESRWIAGCIVISFGFAHSPVFTLLAPVCGALICAYFIHMLASRYQCSLLEFLVMIVALGGVLGLILTTPALYYLGWVWVAAIVSCATGWVLYGAVLGLTHARLLGAESSRARVGYMAVAWFTSAAFAMVLAGSLLLAPHLLGPRGVQFFGARLSQAGVPLLLVGALGLGVNLIVGRKVKRAARRIMGELPVAQ